MIRSHNHSVVTNQSNSRRNRAIRTLMLGAAVWAATPTSAMAGSPNVYNWGGQSSFTASWSDAENWSPFGVPFGSAIANVSNQGQSPVLNSNITIAGVNFT